MKRITSILYGLKTLLFIIHFYFVFIMLHDILDTKIYGYVFLFFLFIYIIKNILELLSQKKRYKNDLIYNFMQISFLSYIIFLAIKVSTNEMYVTNSTYSYFRTNYIISSILLIFILAYDFVELRNKKKKIWSKN